MMPLHVVEGFLESDLSMRDSGVLTKKGIFELCVVDQVLLRFELNDLFFDRRLVSRIETRQPP